MNDDASSIGLGQASAAVAMANDAIDNARRAAATSRNRRNAAAKAQAEEAKAQAEAQARNQARAQFTSNTPTGINSNNSNRKNTPRTPRSKPIPGTAEFVKNNSPGGTNKGGNKATSASTAAAAAAAGMNNNNNNNNPTHTDLKHNDNAYHVLATLVTERLLPKIHASPPGSTHYSLTGDDAAFFQKMLPRNVRRGFVDAVRYRSQLLKSGVGRKDGALGKLTMNCVLLGLDRENRNLLLDLNDGSVVGGSYPINYKNQGPVAISPKASDSFAYNNNNNNNNGSYSIHTGTQRDNGIHFGLSSPMQFSPNNGDGDDNNNNNNNNNHHHHTFSPSNTTHNDGNGDNENIFNLDPNQAALSYQEQWETSAESLARQQIMAEINETKFLMRGSVTPDAVEFWKRHLEELSQRLVALSLEEQLMAAGSPVGSVVGGGADVHAAGFHRDNYENAMDAYDDNGDDRVQQKNYQMPNIRTREEYVESNRRMGEEAGLGQQQQHAPHGPNNGSTHVVEVAQPYHHHHHPPAMDPSVLEANAEAVASVPTTPHSPTTPQPPHATASNGRQQQQQPPPPPRDELPVCDVVAPSDLPGGYMFEAQLGAKKFLATVPPGGVTKGQRFVSTMRELETIEIPVPLGAWRDGGRDCCGDGLLHPLFLNTVFFPCIALGQIMTRTGLDWMGDPANKLVSSLSCANMTVLLTFWLAMNASFAFMLRVAWERGRYLTSEHYAVLALFNVLVLLYMVNLTRKVRGSIRNKYQIPEEHCVGLEDCCCAAFCMPCAICQMGRHTADFDTYRATCCTKTGLPRQVELAPVTFYEDQYQNMNEEGQGQSHVI